MSGPSRMASSTGRIVSIEKRRISNRRSSSMETPIANTIDDKMTELVKMQMHNGAFEIFPDKWNGSVFDTYVGSFENVKLGCPKGIKLNMWTTALAMQIMKLKMSAKRDLWELVSEKSKMYLLRELGNSEEEYKELQEKAGEYVTNGDN